MDQLASHGLITRGRSSKCRVLRVANTALLANTIPAIKVSRISTVRPDFFRSDARVAAWSAADSSKISTLPSKSSSRSMENRPSNNFRRSPSGSKAKPNRISNNVIAVIHTDWAGWPFSQETTLGSGRSRIKADKTLVSRIITRNPRVKLFARATPAGLHPAQSR